MSPAIPLPAWLWQVLEAWTLKPAAASQRVVVCGMRGECRVSGERGILFSAVELRDQVCK